MQKNEVAIIIPCFNEEFTILKIFKNTKQYGRVLIINDCSSDGTQKLLLKNKIKFLENKKK